MAKKSRIKFLLYIINYFFICLPLFKLLKGWMVEWNRRGRSGLDSVRLRHFVEWSLCFEKSTSRMHFYVKYIPKYLTTRFWGCIFAVLKVHHGLHRFPQSFFYLPSCHADDRRGWRISGTSTEKAALCIRDPSLRYASLWMTLKENSVRLLKLCGEKNS